MFVATLSFAGIAVAQSTVFKLAAENPSIGPYAINTYHTGAGLSYMSTTTRDVYSGANFYFNGSYLTQQTPSNIPVGAFIAYVDVPSGADCGVVQVGVGSSDTSLTSFSSSSSLLALEGHTDRFYVCGATSFNTTIESVVYATTDSAPSDGGDIVDVSSCYSASIAQIFGNGTITTTSHNGTFTTSRNATFTHSPTITRHTTRTTITGKPSTITGRTTLCSSCYTTVVSCPTCPGSSSVVTRTSTAIATTRPTSTPTQASAASKSKFSLFLLLAALLF